jgi:hypothetical protein
LDNEFNEDHSCSRLVSFTTAFNESSSYCHIISPFCNCILKITANECHCVCVCARIHFLLGKALCELADFDIFRDNMYPATQFLSRGIPFIFNTWIVRHLTEEDYAVSFFFPPILISVTTFWVYDCNLHLKMEFGSLYSEPDFLKWGVFTHYCSCDVSFHLLGFDIASVISVYVFVACFNSNFLYFSVFFVCVLYVLCCCYCCCSELRCNLFW